MDSVELSVTGATTPQWSTIPAPRGPDQPPAPVPPGPEPPRPHPPFPAPPLPEPEPEPAPEPKPPGQAQPDTSGIDRGSRRPGGSIRALLNPVGHSGAARWPVQQARSQ